MSREDAALRSRVLAMTQTFGPRVYTIARRYARTRTDAEDLMQEIWARVIEVLPRKDPDSPPGGWLTVLAVNVGREWSRNRYRWTDFKDRAFRFFTIEQETHRDSGEEGHIRTEAEARVWKAVDALPELQRNAVVLRVFEGMSTREAAEAIERSEGTVKASLHRGLETLRTRLGDLEDLWARGDL